MDCEFKLIIDGQTDLSVAEKSNIKKFLSDRCGYDRSLDIDQLIEGAPFTVRRSEDRGDLELFCRELRQIGAQALIVEQTRPRRVPSEIRKPGFQTFYRKYTERLHTIMQSLDVARVEQLIESMLRARSEGRQIFIFGNGGSASLASHMVTDMAKERFDDERARFRVQSLNDNIAWFSATANDFGYENVFANQLKNLLQPKDMVIAISSSGNSPNVVKAVQYARSKGAETWGIVGFDGGTLMQEASQTIFIPTKKGQYGYMEDAVSILGHITSVYIYERDQVIYG
jgi:D-sedoheptulose 7-phosphate isomerase